jgi:hypothetical protein
MSATGNAVVPEGESPAGRCDVTDREPPRVDAGVLQTDQVPSRDAQKAASRLSRLRVGAYGSAGLACLYAVVSAYWTLGGTALLATVGRPVEELARNPTAAAVGLGAGVTAAKLAGAGLSLALVQAWGRRLPQQLLVWAATTAAAVLTIYGGLLVVVGALALLGVLGPPPTEPTALRWHVLVWDLWFLLWGLLLGTAAWQRRHLQSDRATVVR